LLGNFNRLATIAFDLYSASPSGYPIQDVLVENCALRPYFNNPVSFLVIDDMPREKPSTLGPFCRN